MSQPTLLVGPSEPSPGVDYAHVLQAEPTSATRPRAALTILMGLSLYFLVVPLMAQLLYSLGWLAAGRPGSMADYSAASARFEHPIGLLGGHIALAMLIPISILLVRAFHGRSPRWLASVQPGMRWRYLAICFVVAAVVLNGMVIASGRLSHGSPRAEAGLWVWLAIVVLSSPLQAAAEEYFFRGLLLQGFGALARRPWLGVVCSALVFALMHGTQNLPLFLDRFGFGLLAGLLVLRTGGLEAGIACHVANNVFAFAWALFYGGVAQLRATQAVGWAQLATDLVGFGLFAIIAWWIGRRMNLATRTPSALV